MPQFRIRRNLLLLVLLAMCVPAPSEAGLDEGFKAHQRGDYSKAVREYQPLAERGSASAQFFMGVLYANGHGVSKNLEKALYWYRLSANQGHGLAQTDLATLYSKGEGVPQDYEEAVRLYKLAAEEGYALAQHNFASMYYFGQGVPKDYREAFRLLSLAAEQGLGSAQTMLGIMYTKETGIPQDYVQAHKWLNLAAASGDEGARKIRDEIAKKMTPQQINQAQRLARDWKPTSQERSRYLSLLHKLIEEEKLSEEEFN